MNSYIQLMNQVIDYIEVNIREPLTLQEIAGKFYLSEFHFSRMFKILSGRSLKQYILGRKLTLAAEGMTTDSYTITSAALDYGFEYPEVFSRSFKKQFGISPSIYRNGRTPIDKVDKAFVVEREIMNIKGTFTIKETFHYIKSLELYGVYTDVNENSTDFDEILNETGGRFVNEFGEYFEERKLYSVVNCHGDDSGEYTVFFGAEITDAECNSKLKQRSIPEGWYASFKYYGDMLDVRGTFVDDLYRWIMLKEIKLSDNHIGMINIYDRKDVYDVRILVPIIMPELQQEASCSRK